MNPEQRRYLRESRGCEEEVIRAGKAEPCETTAVAARYDLNHGSAPYPVCAQHVRGLMVPLSVLMTEDRT